MEWWSIFQKVASADAVDKSSGLVTGWKIDLTQALAAFQLYGVTDARFGTQMLDWIEHCLRSDTDLADEFILYGDDGTDVTAEYDED